MATKNLHVLMTADAKQVEQSLGRLEEGLKRLEKGANKSLGKASGLGLVLDPVALGAKFQQFARDLPLVGDLTGFLDPTRWGEVATKIRETSKAMEEQGKTAKQFGASVEGYSGLLFAAGLDTQTLNTALDKLSENIGQALLGSEEMQKAFADLGLDVNQLAKLDTSEAFLRTVRAMEKEEDMYRRLAKAGAIFGKVADDVNRSAVKGEESIRRRMAMGKETGVVTGEKDYQMVLKANEAWRNLNAQNDSFWTKLSTSTAPLIEQIANDLERIMRIRFDDSQKGPGLVESFGRSLEVAYRIFAKNEAATAYGDVFMNMTAQEQAAERAVAQEEKLQEMRRKAAATDKQIAAEKARVLKEQEDARKKEEETLRRTQSVIDLGDTPWAKFQKRIADINAVADLGRLTWDQYNAALAAVVNEFDRFNEIRNEYRPAEGLEFGTGAEFGARARFESEGQTATAVGQNRIEDLTKKLVDEAKLSREANQGTHEILKKLGLAKY